MIFYAKDRQANVNEGMRDGKGETHLLMSLHDHVHPGNTCFKMVGQVTLPQGSSIGFHTHDNDEEIYLITTGEGIYTDANGQTYPVSVGDLALTRQGEGHGLANSGDGPLSFIAIIAK